MTLTGVHVEVVTVDDRGAITGTAPREAAHCGGGVAHLAVSVVIFHPDGRILLQRRAAGKPLFAELWSNAVCTHPLPGEAPIDAAGRRLVEELGLSCILEPAGAFSYVARDPVSGMIERELDHVFVGRSGDEPRPEPTEVSEVRWVSAADLEREQVASAEQFTPWFAQVLETAGTVARRALPRPPLDRPGSEGSQ